MLSWEIKGISPCRWHRILIQINTSVQTVRSAMKENQKEGFQMTLEGLNWTEMWTETRQQWAESQWALLQASKAPPGSGAGDGAACTHGVSGFILRAKRSCLSVSGLGWIMLFLPLLSQVPGSSDGKALAGNAGDPGSIPGLGRSPWRRKWLPAPAPLTGKSHGQRSLVGYILSMGSQRVRLNWVTSLSLSPFIYWNATWCFRMWPFLETWSLQR